MSPDTSQPLSQPEKRRHGRHAFIPAGIFIGLGTGILLGYVVSGALIGLGLGFLATSLLSFREAPDPATASVPCCGPAGMRGPPILVGVFLILVGIGLAWAPLLVWPYMFALLLILIGIGFLFRGFRNPD